MLEIRRPRLSGRAHSEATISSSSQLDSSLPLCLGHRSLVTLTSDGFCDVAYSWGMDAESSLTSSRRPRAAFATRLYAWGTDAQSSLTAFRSPPLTPPTSPFSFPSSVDISSPYSPPKFLFFRLLAVRATFATRLYSSGTDASTSVNPGRPSRLPSLPLPPTAPSPSSPPTPLPLPRSLPHLTISKFVCCCGAGALGARTPKPAWPPRPLPPPARPYYFTSPA